MKKNFSLKLTSILAIIVLLFAGCSNRTKAENNLRGVNSKLQTSVISKNSNTSVLNKDSKNITDEDLLNSANEDSTSQLDSLDAQDQNLTTDEINILLNDNNDLKNMPSNFSVK